MSDREEFVARHIGHDTATTRYSVDRTSRVQQGPTNTTGAAPFPGTLEQSAIVLAV